MKTKIIEVIGIILTAIGTIVTTIGIIITLISMNQSQVNLDTIVINNGQNITIQQNIYHMEK